MITSLYVLGQNLGKSSSLDRSSSPVNSSVYADTNFKHCKSFLLLQAMYLEVADGYYNTDTLTFKYLKLKEFYNLSNISIFNFKRSIFTILVLRNRYRKRFWYCCS